MFPKVFVSVAPMMKTMNQPPRCARISTSVLRCNAVFLLGVAMIAAQSRTTTGSSAQTNSTGSGKRQPVATLRSSDSQDGSRVTLRSDQSLNDYEVYRSGDRFYVKIPAAAVPDTEALRGRGFADVKTQRNGDSTVVSFRLQPGVTAHAEQHSNSLDLVFTVPGGRRSELSTSSPEVPRSITVSEANKDSNSLRNAGPSTPTNSNKAGPPATALNSTSKAGASPVSDPSGIAQLATPAPVLKSSLAASPSPVHPPTPATTNQLRQDRWGQMKARANYWILLAQLNPLPVAIGVAVLLLLSGLFFLHRQRAKSPSRARPVVGKSATAATTNDVAQSVQDAAESEPEPVITPPVAAAALATPLVAAARTREARPEPVKVRAPAPPAAASPLASDEPRRERVTRVTEEAKNLLAGGRYDQRVIGSDDGETRQLVGAELLSAIVGRNAQRREYAREAFMKHGYFDDATRDLRVAGSANERAAAARRLSFVHDHEATPHLIGALDDPAPDVRRAAVEALMDLRDPAAIAPLNSLMQTEKDRKVPRTLIKHAIDACATVAPEEAPSVAGANFSPTTIPEPSSQPIETEREVFEL